MKHLILLVAGLLLIGSISYAAEVKKDIVKEADEVQAKADKVLAGIIISPEFIKEQIAKYDEQIKINQDYIIKLQQELSTVQASTIALNGAKAGLQELLKKDEVQKPVEVK